MPIKNIDFHLKKNKNLYRIYFVFTSIYYFIRFVIIAIKENSIRLLRYYPGHYSSPIPSKKSLLNNEETIFNRNVESIEGVNLNKEFQLELIESFFGFSKEINFPKFKQAGKRYYFDNPMFGYIDAYILISILKKFSPSKLIEIGSGYSSALLLDSIDLDNNQDLTLTFIEPYPDRLYSLIDDDDRGRTTIIENNIQDVSLETFKSLKSNDILFVDTSHVLKIDSDLSKIIFSILPVLNEGVLIHFHDIFWPFEYPRAIIDDGRLWNESYFLRSFLQYNDKFEILLFTSYLESFYKEQMIKNNPCFENATGSSLWLRKK